MSKEVEKLEYDEEARTCQFLLTSLNGFEPQVPRFYIHFKVFKLSIAQLRVAKMSKAHSSSAENSKLVKCQMFHVVLEF